MYVTILRYKRNKQNKPASTIPLPITMAAIILRKLSCCGCWGVSFFLVGCTTPIGGVKKVEDIKPQETPSIETIEAGLWMQMNKYEENLKTSGTRNKDKNLEKYLKNN